jgi:hypothetical protein
LKNKLSNENKILEVSEMIPDLRILKITENFLARQT